MYVPVELVLKIVGLCSDIQVRMAFGVFKKIDMSRFIAVDVALRRRFRAQAVTSYGDVEHRVVVGDRVHLYFNETGNELSAYWIVTPGTSDVKAMIRSDAVKYADKAVCLIDDTYPKADCRGTPRRPSNEVVHVYDTFPRLDCRTVRPGSKIMFVDAHGCDRWIAMASLAKDLADLSGQESVSVVDAPYDSSAKVPESGTVIACVFVEDPDYVFLRGVHDSLHREWLLQAFDTLDQARAALRHVRTMERPWRADRHLVLGPLMDGKRSVLEYSCATSVAELRDPKS